MGIKIDAKWHIVFTKPRREKKVVELLEKKKIESYCPQNKVSSALTNHKVVSVQLLFPSYVFVRISEDQVNEVLRTSGVINFMYWLKTPAIVPDRDIEMVKYFLSEYENLQVERTEVKVSEASSIIRGTLVSKTGNMPSHCVQAVLPSLGFVLISEADSFIDTHQPNNNTFYKTTEQVIIKEQF
ncbi:MAG TPA: UpxY family transcription antiterminator [Chitinophagaceae bacterium]|jgi:transcription antitermination factor NusG|nr:UpxY family transcription antiterminator [Chitinophagaceae bacterium]